jgi:hypothetical protein
LCGRERKKGMRDRQIDRQTDVKEREVRKSGKVERNNTERGSENTKKSNWEYIKKISRKRERERGTLKIVK